MFLFLSLSLSQPPTLPVCVCVCVCVFLKCQLKKNEPWLVWLSELGVILQTEAPPVRFPIRAHAWVAVQMTI